MVKPQYESFQTSLEKTDSVCKYSKPGHRLGCLGSAAMIGGLFAVFTLGPIDFCRSVYNQIIGDTPVLKHQLTDYCRKGLQRELKIPASSELESRLAVRLDTTVDNGAINPQNVSIESLWNEAEDLAPSFYQRLVWPFLP